MPISQEGKSPCCCHSRRLFLQGIIAEYIAVACLNVGSAQAAAQARALVLSCIDYRFLTSERKFLESLHLADQYDWTALAGASLALAGFPHQADAIAFWDQLKVSYELHHIQKVIILDHQDCGAYALNQEVNLKQDPIQEEAVHQDYLSRAFYTIKQHYPTLQVELYFATLTGLIKPIWPAMGLKKLTKR